MTKLSSRLDSHGFSGWMDEGFRQKPPPSVWSLAVDVSGWVLQLDGPRTWLNFTAAEKSSRGCGILGRTRDSVETSTSGLLKGYGMYGSKSPAQVTKFKPSTWVALDDWPLNEEALGPGSGVVAKTANWQSWALIRGEKHMVNHDNLGFAAGFWCLNPLFVRLIPSLLPLEGGFEDAWPLCTVSTPFRASAQISGISDFTKNH